MPPHHSRAIASLREKLADLQRQLRQAQERINELWPELTKAQEERDRADEAYSTGMIMKSCEVERVEAERDAAIERGRQTYQWCEVGWVEALLRIQLMRTWKKRAEAAERKYDTEMAYTADLEAALACDYCSSPLDHPKHLASDVQDAKTELAEQRALAEELANAADALQAKVPRTIADAELVRVIHAIRAVRLAPAEAQEEGDPRD